MQGESRDINYKALLSLGCELRESGIPADIMKLAQRENYLFTPTQVESAVSAIANDMLVADKIDCWLTDRSSKYSSTLVVMAGNIPLVGFFDMMCVLLLGVDCYIKPSTKDRVLICWVRDRLIHYGVTTLHLWDGEFMPESVIATGSNNAGRYFEQRFGTLPAVIRGSRSSVAVIDGAESAEEIEGLWHDIFDYFGLGCRNVSHLLIPIGYDISSLVYRLSMMKIEDKHYLNAYKQARALCVINGEPFIDGGYFLAQEGSNLTPPMGCITYSTFDSGIIAENGDNLQVVVGREYVPFGLGQRPALDDWADGINLFDFLCGSKICIS